MVLQTLNFNHFNPRSYQYFSLYQHTTVIKRSLFLTSACMRHGYVKVTHVSNALAIRRLFISRGTAITLNSIEWFRWYRAVNTLCLGYKNQSINAVQRNNRYFSEILKNINKIECCDVKQSGTKRKRWDLRSCVLTALQFDHTAFQFAMSLRYLAVTLLCQHKSLSTRCPRLTAQQ